MMKELPSDYEIKFFKTVDEFEEWLHENHASTKGVWLKFAKKGSGIASTNRAETLDVALCYGWIDGQSRTIDETYYLQKYTPRTKRSMWSKINRDIVARLIKEKRMKAAGMREIETAQSDGRWDAAYDSPKNMVIPEDFLSLLAKDAKAETFFKTLNKTNVYAITWRLQTAKKPETRQRRMEQLLSMLHDEQKLH